tara:strand:- start:2439 stop:2597 length:159 start_codon:yes stop_codon:yes gene_type:complete
MTECFDRLSATAMSISSAAVWLAKAGIMITAIASVVLVSFTRSILRAGTKKR